MRFTVQVLRKAKSLIKFKKNWLQYDFAAMDDDTPVNATAALATKFCSIGALRHVCYPSDQIRPYLSYAVQIMSAGEEKNVSAFNDTRTHEEILEMFDIAIAWAEGELEDEQI